MINRYRLRGGRAGLFHGDNLAVLPRFPENTFHAIVTDPPYGLSKEPDAEEVLRHWLAGDDYRHRGAGFMGKKWDSFVPGPSTWRECFRVLRPGGHLLAFGGTRTYDLQVLAIRIAGFEIRDSLHWMYGSGFPKSLNLGHKSEFWRGYGTALKPGHEPIVLARKPLEGTVAANLAKWGVGGLNIDGCRTARPRPTSNHGASHAASQSKGIYGAGTSNPAGRPAEQRPGQELGGYPINVLLTHAYDCERVGEEELDGGGHHPGGQGGLRERGGRERVAVWRCAEGCPVADLNDQAPAAGAAARASSPRGIGQHEHGIGGKRADGFRSDGEGAAFYGDKGGASRFFPTSQWSEADLVPFHYAAKAGQKERERGLDELDAVSGAAAVGRKEGLAGTRSPRAGAGRTASKLRNLHPTVKPLGLMRWCVRLVTPPDGLVLDPFAGSGTTLLAGVAEGARVVGIESDTEHGYIDIIRGRVGE